MCLSTVVRIDEVSADGARAAGIAGGRRVEVSLAVLVMEGGAPRPGDWILAHTGLALEVLTPEEAARIEDARAQL